MKRVLIIPAHREQASLEKLLGSIHECAPDFEVVVVDDGSEDGTAATASACGARVLRHSCNLGYGAAVQTGYRYALERGAELAVQMDADGQHDPADIGALAEPVEKGECDVVIGSRFLGAGDYRMGIVKRIGSRVLRAMLDAMGVRVTDPTSGFQALSPAALRLYTQDFFPSDYPDIDVLVIAQRSGLRIGERPVTMSAGARPSQLHSGLAPFYYMYKMLLSLWAASAAPRGRRDAR